MHRLKFLKNLALSDRLIKMRLETSDLLVSGCVIVQPGLRIVQSHRNENALATRLPRSCQLIDTPCRCSAHPTAQPHKSLVCKPTTSYVLVTFLSNETLLQTGGLFRGRHPKSQCDFSQSQKCRPRVRGFNSEHETAIHRAVEQLYRPRHPIRRSVDFAEHQRMCVFRSQHHRILRHLSS